MMFKRHKITIKEVEGQYEKKRVYLKKKEIELQRV